LLLNYSQQVEHVLWLQVGKLELSFAHLHNDLL
jgi:hypothetical protein